MIRTNDDLLEPVLNVNDIQGNIIPGFNKDHQSLLFLGIVDTKQARKWIASVSSHISTLYEVQNFKNVYESEKARLGQEPYNLAATWTNIAISYDGMKKLAKNMEQVDPYLDKNFKVGINGAVSVNLGDPQDPSAEGNYNKWVIGGPNSKPDILLIVASDNLEAVETQVQSLVSQASSYGLKKIYEQPGHDLSYYGNEAKRGHEHFGFKDGISQPGVRGRLSNVTSDYLTPRSENSISDSNLPEISSTGSKPLIAAGEFVIGYPTQNQNHPRMANPAGPTPEILKNGSYLVFRRLRQDVEAFENFVTRESKKMSESPGFSDITADKLKAFLVGRWPSGAPLALSSDQDNPQLAKDPCNINKFGYNDDDQYGHKTPLISHIRKVNPRDLPTDQGFSARTLKHRILRRGIPFGQPFDASKPDPISGDRGLLFLSYQTSIETQFEFLVKNWMNSPVHPTNFLDSEGKNSGVDLLVGQHTKEGNTDACIQRPVNEQTVYVPITTKGLRLLDWVVPTGGGYFFSPSISCLKSFLGYTE